MKSWWNLKKYGVKRESVETINGIVEKFSL